MSDNRRNPIYASGYCFHNSRYEYRAITSSLLYLSARVEYEENYKIAICRDFYQRALYLYLLSYYYSEQLQTFI